MGLTRRRFFVGSGFALANLAAQPNPPPNVLLVMSDQESALLPGPINLPNRKRLLDRGLSFNYAFCDTPQSAATIGGVFQKAGYTTGLFDDRQGVDDPQIASTAAKWIRRQKEPWLGSVSFSNPHGIYHFPEDSATTLSRPGVSPPASDRSDLLSKPSEQFEFLDKDEARPTRDYSTADWIRYRSYYLRLIEKVDVQLGVILNAINPANTIVVYTSNHGDALGEHGLPFNGPFMHEELIRIPLVIAGPGVTKGVSDEMTTQAEIAPMLAKYAGIPWSGPKRSGDPHAVFLENDTIHTIRTRQWKLNSYDSGHKELYDLTADPHETINLADNPAFTEIQTNLESRLTAWRH